MTTPPSTDSTDSTAESSASLPAESSASLPAESSASPRAESPASPRAESSASLPAEGQASLPAESPTASTPDPLPLQAGEGDEGDATPTANETLAAEGPAPAEVAEGAVEGGGGDAPASLEGPPPASALPRLAPSAPRPAARVLLDPPLDASGVPPTPPRRKRHPFRLPRIRAPRAAFVLTAAVAALLAAMTRLGEPLRTAMAPSSPTPLSALRSATSGETLGAESAAPKVPSAGAPKATAHEEAPPAGGPWRIDELAHDPGVRLVRGKLGQNALVDALEGAKVPKAQIYRLLAAFPDAKRFDRPKKNDAFAVAIDRAGGKVRAFEYQASVSDVWQAREDASGKLVGSKLDLHVEQRRVARAVLVRDDLKSSVVEAGFDDDLIDALDDALEDRVALTSLHRGAALRIIAQEQTVLGKFARYADVEAVEYLPPSRGATPVRVYHYKAGKAAGYYDARGRAPYQGGWRYPVRFPRVTSRFNPKRMHPVLHRTMPHNGCDFGAPSGTPVYAAAHGTVDFVGNHGPSGNLVLVDHGSGTTTGYAHLSRFAPGIKPGDKVEARQLVGFVGSTGRSTAPHLHFSLKKNGAFVDPLTLKMDGERVLPPSEREGFEALRRQLDSLIDSIELPDRPRETEPEPEPVDEPADEEGPADAAIAAAPQAASAQTASLAAAPPPASPSPAPAAAPEADPSVDSAVWRPAGATK